MTGWDFLVCKGFLLNLSIAKQKIELLKGRKVQLGIVKYLALCGPMACPWNLMILFICRETLISAIMCTET
jgi:hypothetical protein